MLENVSYSDKDFIDKLFSFVNSLIIKDPKLAEENETLDTARTANEYILSYSGRDSFFSYPSYSRTEMVSVGMKDEKEIQNGLSNPNLIPERFRDALLQQKRKSIIDSYDEKNNYYRMLNGLPDYGEAPIMCSFGKPVTQLDLREVSILERSELAELKKRNPGKLYLDHLGNKRVSYYDARIAKPFYLLNYGRYVFEDERAKKFIELYYQTLVYTQNVVYSDAFKHYDYYNNFIILFMVFDTTQKFINEQFNYAIRKDFFDTESLKNTFLSYGLPYFEEIPLRYQTRIVKNINELLKFKGTNKVLVDIVNLFGFTNAELFRYYLVKDFKRKKDGTLDIDFKDHRNSYELNFAQVPLDTTDISSSLRKKWLYQKYEDVVADDPFWGITEGDDEDTEEDSFKNQLLDAEFNYINTKYLSMNTMLDMTQANFEACYFFNLINTLENHGLLDDMTFFNKDLKSSGSYVRVFDVVTAIFYLLFKRFGYDDNIIYTPTAIGSIFGFNFDGDLETLKNIVKEQASMQIGEVKTKFDMSKLTEAELRVISHEGMDIQKGSLVELFFNNKEYGQYLRNKMIKTQSYDEYKALNAIYNYNMYSDAIKDLYIDGDDNVYSTYSDYLKDNDPELFEYVTLNSSSRENTIKALDTLLLSLESYFNSPKFQFIFASLSNISGELVKTYMARIINIFKAYSVELRKINIYYLFDDKFSNMLRMFSYLQSSVDQTVADSVLKEALDESSITGNQMLIEKELNRLKEYFAHNANLTIKDSGIDMNQLIDKLTMHVKKADSISEELVDFASIFTEIHADDIQTLKEDNNLIIRQLYNTQLEVDEGLTNILHLKDADSLYKKSDSIGGLKTLHKDDSGIEFREAFKIIY